MFLAEGGNRELGSAMTIALAKGFLLYTARLDLTPVEILRRLRATLASVLRDDTPMTVLYAVIDGHTGSVSYARAGDWPRLAINGKPLAEEIVSDRTSGFVVRHGVSTLAPLDAIFFYTDGWAVQIAERTRTGPEEFIERTTRKFAGSVAALHQALVGAALRKKDAPPDDVTAVMVRREEPAARVVEEIA